ncbi:MULTISPECIES: hypothetical protein [unclassified Sulfuricurvum]|uniref:hypothetical protein n=1 Tax=unclassified Sulfuricurvum TaxID=2632390 RepID=UPI0002995E6F|nr:MULTISPECIES: hypothetical protein [unclassified Sulfuricurvum]OHD83999.1 MAG: hypothetical protein A2Y52_06935 [Sulfuricurvum sp. RIFCSPLOWO2_02_43_6]OHD84258.1 MAG: hypothetical protein A3D90_11805 [Sulfuricurvum sp. RIFCSPHIGHO2_02_FULL_43_9]OHD85309.1 MAG: hypothetical protein A3I60_04290 [Sulfuricurvum sp. RIFCSPLOWO2_02_FULL_43_45]OHD88058.1 MAG: hypothetical protein A3J39_01585 [Sulfuricurvum sp. RIFCSPHIGHO2_12_FULL_44_8]OHD89388.1 MAG: hypothetical protein A2W83_05355 [Sulfuricurvu
MVDILREAQGQFQQVHQLLDEKNVRDGNYFTQLSIATEEAYVLMNEGMCANTSVCHECADHRDFIRSMLDVLGELEVNASAANNYTDKFAQYAERINKILTNIKTVLAS